MADQAEEVVQRGAGEEGVGALLISQRRGWRLAVVVAGAHHRVVIERLEPL